jgi:hypothetical protein
LPANALRWAGLKASLKHILQHRLVQTQVCNELLKLPILPVQLVQTAELRHAKSAVFLFPVIFQLKNAASQMPFFRQTSATVVLLSDWRSANAICFSVYLVLFMAKQSSGDSWFCLKLYFQTLQMAGRSSALAPSHPQLGFHINESRSRHRSQRSNNITLSVFKI